MRHDGADWQVVNGSAPPQTLSISGATADAVNRLAVPPALAVSKQLVSGTADIWSVLSGVSATGFDLLPVALSARVQDRVADYTARGQAPGIGAANTGIATVITGVPAISESGAVSQTLIETAARITGSPTPVRA